VTAQIKSRKWILTHIDKKTLCHRRASFEGGTHEENVEEEDRERDGKEG